MFNEWKLQATNIRKEQHYKSKLGIHAVTAMWVVIVMGCIPFAHL